MNRIFPALLSLLLVAAGFSVIPLLTGDFVENRIGGQDVARISSSSATHSYTVFEDYFNDSSLSDWQIWKGHPSVITAVVNGELWCEPASGWAGYWLKHNVSLAKQDFQLSFNYRIGSNATPQGYQTVILFNSLGWYSYPSTELMTGIKLQIKDGTYQIHITSDDGTATDPPSFSQADTAALWPDHNYQFSLHFWGANNSVQVDIYNKTGANYLHHETYWTYGTGIQSRNPIVDQIWLGDVSELPNWNAYTYYDNFTVTEIIPDHSEEVLDSTNVTAAVYSFAQNHLLQMEYSPGKYRLGYDLTLENTWGTPVYTLISNDLTNARDDVAGELLTTLSQLYQFYGDSDYLDMAKELWAALKIHQQADGGWTFGGIGTDYSDTNARIIIGLCALYSVTDDSTYLDHAALAATHMQTFQNASGMVFGRLDRPSTYSRGEEVYFASYFSIANLELYKWTSNSSLLYEANETLHWILNRSSPSGRYVTPGVLDTLYDPDFNDVVSSGLALWALSEGYKATGYTPYLTRNQATALYLSTSQFVKGSESFGVWAGLLKYRHNQSDLLYTYPILHGLSAYLDTTTDILARETLNASLNYLAEIQGTNSSVQGDAIYHSAGVWASSWNLNDTVHPGWTHGWFAEGGWGTWGTVVFYGWQGCIVQIMLRALAAPENSTIYTSSVEKINEDNTVTRHSLSACTEKGDLTVSSPTAPLLVFIIDQNSTHILWTANGSSGTASFTVSERTIGETEDLYVDQVIVAKIPVSAGGTVSFQWSAWSSHDFEVSTPTTYDNEEAADRDENSRSSPSSSTAGEISLSLTSISMIAIVLISLLIILILVRRPGHGQRTKYR